MTADEQRKSKRAVRRTRLLAALLVATGTAGFSTAVPGQTPTRTKDELKADLAKYETDLRGQALKSDVLPLSPEKNLAAERDRTLQQDKSIAIPGKLDNQFYQMELGDARLRRVVKVLQADSKTDVNQYVPKAFEFHNVSPYNVLRYVRRVADLEEGAYWTFVAPDGKSGVLLVNVPSWQVEPLTELVSIIDRPNQTNSDGRKRVYLPLEYRDPSQVAPALAPYLTASGVVVPDPATGHIYIEDNPSGTDYAVAYLPKDLDIPIKQVVIRAKIYEVDLTNDGTIGLDYTAWKNGPGRNLFAIGAFGEYFKQTTSTGGAPVVSPGGVDVNGLPGQRFNNSGANAGYFYDVPSAYFDFLVTKGRARVLTAPSATVLNTETATFSTGEQILFYRVLTQNDAAPRATALDPTGADAAYPDNRTVNGEVLDRADAGVNMQVRPVIGEESVVLEVSLTFASQLGFDDAGVPQLHSREINTTIRATPDKEYIIGGMSRTQSLQTSRKIPGLGSLPVAGWLFGGETTTAKKSMLAIVLTADVLDEAATLTPDEAQLVQKVSTAGMNQVPLPSTLWGFDMMLLGKEAAK